MRSVLVSTFEKAVRGPRNVCAVHDDDVDGELKRCFLSKSVLQAGDAEGVVRPKGAAARRRLKEGQKRQQRGKVYELD